MNILVLGGNGFIGSSIVKALRKNDIQVLIGSRKNTQTDTNIRIIKLHKMLVMSDWLAQLQDIDVVVNAVGILRERRNESYNAVHNIAPTALASACAQLNIRLIQISALGLSINAKSNFIRSKYKGEQAILASGASAVIVRPSLLDGEGGYGAKWFRRIANWPIHFVMNTDGKVAPLQVLDLGEAVKNLCLMGKNELPKTVELGGNDVMGIQQYLAKLRGAIGKTPALQFKVPKTVVRIASHICDILNWTPLSFGHYELMQGYNAPATNFLPALLGRKPTELGAMGNYKIITYRLKTVADS